MYVIGIYTVTSTTIYDRIEYKHDAVYLESPHTLTIGCLLFGPQMCALEYRRRT